MALYSDFDISFAKNPTSGDIQTVEDTRAVAQSVKNLILTNFYERPFQPPLGSAIYLRLFDQFDEITEFTMVQDIRNVVRLYEPRADVKIVRTYKTTGPSGEKISENAILVEVIFSIINLSELVTTRFLLTRLR